jgi:hypothetical protein
MHGLASNVLSCQERERLEQERFEARYARRLFVPVRRLMDCEGLRFVAYARIDARLFPAPVVVAEAVGSMV